MRQARQQVGEGIDGDQLALDHRDARSVVLRGDLDLDRRWRPVRWGVPDESQPVRRVHLLDHAVAFAAVVSDHAHRRAGGGVELDPFREPLLEVLGLGHQPPGPLRVDRDGDFSFDRAFVRHRSSSTCNLKVANMWQPR
jgi:hypothetical protein